MCEQHEPRPGRGKQEMAAAPEAAVRDVVPSIGEEWLILGWPGRQAVKCSSTGPHRFDLSGQSEVHQKP